MNETNPACRHVSRPVATCVKALQLPQGKHMQRQPKRDVRSRHTPHARALSAARWRRRRLTPPRRPRRRRRRCRRGACAGACAAAASRHIMAHAYTLVSHTHFRTHTHAPRSTQHARTSPSPSPPAAAFARGASSPPGLRLRFTDSGFGPFATLRLNCTLVYTRVAAPASSCSACRSCAGTAPCTSWTFGVRRVSSCGCTHTHTQRLGGTHRLVALLLRGQLQADARAVHEQQRHARNLRSKQRISRSAGE
jgi:hypothetical protein